MSFRTLIWAPNHASDKTSVPAAELDDDHFDRKRLLKLIILNHRLCILGNTETPPTILNRPISASRAAGIASKVYAIFGISDALIAN